MDATRPLPNGIGPPRSEWVFANIHLISLHSEQKELVQALRALHSAIRVRIFYPIQAEAHADHADCRGYSARLRTQFLDTGTQSVPLFRAPNSEWILRTAIRRVEFALRAPNGPSEWHFKLPCSEWSFRTANRRPVVHPFRPPPSEHGLRTAIRRASGTPIRAPSSELAV